MKKHKNIKNILKTSKELDVLKLNDFRISNNSNI